MGGVLQDNGFVVCECDNWYAGWDGECGKCSQVPKEEDSDGGEEEEVSPVTMVLPIGWFVDKFEGEIIWENEETGSIVKPCIDVNNTEIFHWNNDTDALIPGPVVR